MKSLPLIGCLGLGLLLVLLLFVGCGGYNRMVTLDEGVNSAWAQVENAYQRRTDLIPNLVETVKGARDFEQETFTQVAEARASAGKVSFDGAPTPEQLRQFEAVQGEISSALSRLLVTVERYPDLKATQAFRDLQAQLEGTENRIATERRRFNTAAESYNTMIRRVPWSWVAGVTGFAKREYFEAQEGSETPPSVDFGS